jgi:hypothetical protein
MGSITLPRMRSVRREEVLTPQSPLHVGHEGATDAGAPGEHPVGQASAGRVQATHELRLPAILVTSLLIPLTSDTTRHWLVEVGATLCVAGGFIAAPFLTLAAWIGLALPRRVLLHEASTALFMVAILWMAAALIGAHLHHHRHPAHATGPADEGE